MTLLTDMEGPLVYSRSSALRWLPFAVLLIACAVLALNWGSLPERWVTHWNMRGEPDGWANKTPLNVFLPLMAGTFVCGFLEVIATYTSRQRTTRVDPRVSPRVVVAVAEATAHLMRKINLALALLLAEISLLLPLARPEGPAVVVVSSIGLLGAALVLGLRGFADEVRGLREGGLLEGLEGWNGIIYRDPRDRRLWVPKPIGGGYTLNYGHRWAWPLTLLLVLGPLLIIALVILLSR
jgi:uncharacterized membrane protein